MVDKISVIVPIYNVEPYLRNCVESILNQTYTNLEIILVNDGSFDKSGEICDEYEKRDNRVKVIHKQNGGLSSARNTGLDIATGELIGFIDGDDFVDRDMYETLYNLLLTNDADVVECGLKKVNAGNIQTVEKVKDSIGGIEIGDNLFALKRLLENPIRNVACNKLYKREMFDDLRYPNKLYEDGFLTYRIYYKLKKYVFIRVNKYNYVQREDSIMGKQKNYTLRNLDGLVVQEERYKFLKSKLDDPAIINLAEYQLFRQILFHYQKISLLSNRIDPEKKYRKMLINIITQNYTSFYVNNYLGKYRNLIRLSRFNFPLFNFAFSRYDYYLNYMDFIKLVIHHLKKKSIIKKFIPR